MNELDTTREREFIWRRLGEAFPLSAADDSATVLLAVVGGLFLLAVGVFLGTILRRGRAGSIVYWLTATTRAAILLLPAVLLLVGKYGKLTQPTALWWTLTVGTFILAVTHTVLSYLRDSRNHFGWWVLTFLGWTALAVGVAVGPVLLVADAHPYLSEGWWVWNGVIAWWTVPVLMLGLGVVVAAAHVLREPHHAGLAWTPLLAQLRIGVYAVLAVAFLLPAMQEREKTRKQSRVLVLIDVSPSVANTSDEQSKGPGTKAKTRLDKILDFLTDADAVAVNGEDQANLMRNLTDKNPVYAFRFGRQLDDDAHLFPAKSAPWTRDEWAAWVNYDFRSVALRGLSEEGRKLAVTAPAWKPDDVGNDTWAAAWAKAAEADAIPDALTPADKAVLQANQTKMLTRVDVARSVVTGTDVPSTLTDLLKRESGNMVKGVIVFSDGRSSPGAAGTTSALRELAEKEKIPIFTVAVGAIREHVSIDITDLQAPSATAPDEPVKVTVSVDAVGLPDQEADVFLDLYLPGQDAKTDSPVHTLSRKIKFLPGDPPRGEVEFVLDPDDKLLPEVLTEPSKKEGRVRQFKASIGKENWKLVARVPADKREIFDDKFHVTPPREMLVQDRILRVLMVASAPTREYQTLRTLLVREETQGRARVCVLIQNEGGLKGDIVQDVDPTQVLTRFPDRLDLTNKVRSDDPADRFYNLNEYDLVLMFDPDWDEKAVDGTNRISDQSIRNLATWVDNLGGGLMYVAAPLFTPKLARTDDSSRLRPLVDVLPVEPIDSVLKARGVPRDPRRLLLTPTPLANLLRLEEDIVKDSTDPNYQVAGWEKFFTGQDRYVPTGANQKDYNPKRGIYSYYPVKPKRGASVLAEFVDLDDKEQPVKIPYLVITQPARGRSAFLGSGEIYRIREADTAYYDRFWIKMCRFLVANREAKASRGRVLISKEFVSGGPVRVQARILGPNARPYPADGASSINAKFRIEQLKANGEFVKEVGTFPLAPRTGGNEFDGYYGGQTAADPKLMPTDGFRYRVVVDVPDSGEPLTDTFLLRRSDPELDNLRPDFDAMRAMAGTLDEVAPRIADPKTRLLLRGTAGDDTKAKLAFTLSDTEKLKLIPQCLDATIQTTSLRGKVDDLWDNEMEPPASAELATDFFTGTAFGEGRLGRWGTLFALLAVVLAIAAGVAAIWVAPLVWLAYAFTAAAVAFTYLGNPFPLGDLTAEAYGLGSFRWAVEPFQKDAIGTFQLGTVLAIAFAGIAVLGVLGGMFVAPLKWVAVGGFALALLAIAPVALFADTRLPATAAATTDPYQLSLRWGMLLALPLVVLSVLCFGLSTVIGGLKWTGLALLILAAAAVYLTYPFPVGVVIAVVVSLLSFEWMTRKLMRLA
jgi:hypothetical protein